MLDLKLIRSRPEEVRMSLQRRGEIPDLDRLLAVDAARRGLLQEVEALKNRRNEASTRVGALLKNKEDAAALIDETRVIGGRIKELDEEVRGLDEELRDILLRIPNLPDPEVPEGLTEESNREIRRWGTPREFTFEPLPHWELGERHDVLDFARAAKISGSRFVVYKRWGASLERALINFMLDLHIREHGYIEIFPPLLVRRESMVGTGQLPRFEGDSFKVEGVDLFLNPTAEVPVTNLHRDEILDGELLPLCYAAYAPSFRSEAMAQGKDSRGLIRHHQFNKVELVKITRPEDSPGELEKMVADAEDVLRRLGLAYRVVEICAGDLGQSAARKYDLEVWMPSYGRYVEISSCSNCAGYQARRAGIRYRAKAGAPLEFAHTLNGSGVAAGRTTAAVLENYQGEDGVIKVPEVLRRYLGAEALGTAIR